jgi:hypothetical protein
MKLPKSLLGAVLVGLTVQASSCQKGKEPAPKEEQTAKTGSNSETPKSPMNCPACGMG